MESSPNKLQPPVAPKNRLSKRPMYIFLAAAFILLAALYYAIDYNERRHKQKEEDNAVGITGSPLTRLDNSAGLALPETKEPPPAIITSEPEPKKKEIVPRKPLVVKFAKKDDGDKEERNRKRQLALSALTAPLLKNRQQSNNQPSTVASADGAGGRDYKRGSRGDDARRRAAEHSAPSLGANKSYDPTADIDKEHFLSRADRNRWLSPYTRERGRKYEVKTGTVIPGVMVTGINSDLPGVMIAQIAQNVYDTATGKHLLLPQGSKLYGVYDSRVIYGQSRTLVAWNRIIFPDGTSVTLGAFPGTDVSGYSGFHDKVNNHYLRTFGQILLISVFNAIPSLVEEKESSSSSQSVEIVTYTEQEYKGLDENGKPIIVTLTKQKPVTTAKSKSRGGVSTFSDEFKMSLAEQMAQIGLAITNKNLNIKPTLEIRPGYKFNVIVTNDLVFSSSYKPQPVY